MDKFAVSIEQLNDAVLMGIVSIMVVGTVLALFTFGMGIIQ